MSASEQTRDPRAFPTTPRVSPYRLTAHLSMAFATYGVLMWTGMNLLTGPPRVKSGAFNLSVANSALKALRSRSKGGAALLGLTVLSGAFVAGKAVPYVC